MEYVRGAIGAFFIFTGLAVQGLGWLLHHAGWIIETAGSRLAEW